MNTFEEIITNANVLVESNNYADAIVQYELALKKADRPEYQIDICNTLGRLYISLSDAKNAVKYFKKSLDVHNGLEKEKAKSLAINKATVLNNLGALIMRDNPKESMSFHKEAVMIFESQTEDKYAIQLANTYYSYADASYAKGDFYMAKKQYKNAIEKYQTLDKSDVVDAFTANAHYSLGNIYMDEDNVYDARNNYLKGLKIFRALAEKDPKSYKSLVAATFNNLAVTAKTMYKYTDAITYYEKALEQYEDLLEIDKETFLPFYASTLNSVAIIYAEQHEVKDDYDSFGLTGFSGFGTLSVDNSVGKKDEKEQIEKLRKEKAEEYYKKAIAIYGELTVESPGLYSHYLATAYHNLGVLFDTKKDFKAAEENFEKALNIRRKLAETEPEAFNLDVCVTLFNIVTMYQNLLEQTINIDFKHESLKILKEIEERIQPFMDDKRPVVEGMHSDLIYFKDYFNKVNEEYLDVFDAIVKENAVVDSINENSDPKEKLKMQKHVVNLYIGLQQKYAENPRLQEALLNAYIKYAWFALRSNELAIAENAISNGLKIEKENNNLKVNQAHLHLLKNEFDKAYELYNSVKTTLDEESNPFLKIIDKDRMILNKDGVLSESQNKELVDKVLK